MLEAYTVTVSTLADGSHSLTAKATDASGNTGAASAALAIEVDTAAPPVPTVTANSPSSTGTPVISGVAEASSTVTVYSGDTALGQASADGVEPTASPRRQCWRMAPLNQCNGD